jgi:hypothetical protein
MNIVISWFGFNEDFDKRGEDFIEKADGFTASIQRDIIKQYGIEKHVVLVTTDKSGAISKDLDLKMRRLQHFLKNVYPDQILEYKQTNIDKTELQDFYVIENALRSIIQSFDESDKLFVVAGTGPTAVGMAWCTLSIVMRKRYKLYVLQRPEYVPGGKESTLKEIEPHADQLLDDTLHKHHFSINLPENIYKDEIIELEYKKAFSYAQSRDLNVLIMGETGCGKDKMAEFIHINSPIAKEVYKPINCASLHEDTLYSELFGHVPGSFTGASNVGHIGLFEKCKGGTLFLDEIGDISQYMQQSLLRAIENKEIKKLGANEIIKNVNVRIIAATNNNLYEKCKEGKFRWDLYYRLSNPEIILKPYRERTNESRKKIINYYLEILTTKWGRKLKFTKDAKSIIEQYSFPGNFREIYNTLNSLFPLNSSELRPEDLPARFLMEENQNDENYENVIKNHCIKVYRKYNCDLTEAKKALGYANVTQLKDKLKGWGVLKDI